MRGTAAYALSILQAMLSRFGHKLRVAIDGKEYTGTYMMAAICNGGYYGGGYQAAPYAAMDDGLLDIVLVKPISRIQVAGILAKYKAGQHMQDADTIVPEFRSFMTFTVPAAWKCRCWTTAPSLPQLMASVPR